MVPSVFVVLGSLPVTVNGKLDRAALPDPDAAAESTGFVAPRTPVEETLAGIWSSVLRLERIGAFDNFFDLGGHSLTATAVTAKVRSTFEVELPTRAIFREPVLAGLAGQIETLLRARD
jgi:acyl carrier protein